MARVLVAVAIAGVLAFVALGWALPVAVERGVEAALGDVASAVAGGAAPPVIEARIAERPALRLIVGDVGDITVTTRGAPAETLPAIAAVTTGLHGVRFDVWGLVTRRQATLVRARDLTATLTIGEQALSACLGGPGAGLVGAGLSGAVLRLGEGAAEVSGELKAAGRTFRLRVVGRLVPRGDWQVAFAPDDIILDDVAFGPHVTSKLVEVMGGPAPWLDLGRLPVPLRVQSVTCDEGRLTIVGAAEAAATAR